MQLALLGATLSLNWHSCREKEFVEKSLGLFAEV